MAGTIRALLKEQGTLMKTLKRNTHRSLEGSGYNWLLTHTGRDAMEYAITLVTTLVEGMCAHACACRAGPASAPAARERARHVPC